MENMALSMEYMALSMEYMALFIEIHGNSFDTV